MFISRMKRQIEWSSSNFKKLSPFTIEIKVHNPNKEEEVKVQVMDSLDMQTLLINIKARILFKKEIKIPTQKQQNQS